MVGTGDAVGSTPVEEAYKSGFSKGSAGMSSSYCPQHYYFDSALRDSWFKGWREGRATAGFTGINSRQVAGLSLIALLVLAAVVYSTFLHVGRSDIQASVGDQDSHSYSRMEATVAAGVQELRLPTAFVGADGAEADRSANVQASTVAQDEDPAQKTDVRADAATAVEAQEPRVPTDTNRSFPVSPSTAERAVRSAAASAERGTPVDWSRHVEQPRFTLTVVNRVPGRALSAINTTASVYFFSNIRRYEGRTVAHKWYFNEQLVSRREFAVKGQRWRIYTSYRFAKGDQGAAVVNIVDDQDRLMHSQSIAVNISRH